MPSEIDLEMFSKFENCLNKWTYPIKRELYMRAVLVLAALGNYRAWTEISQYIEYADSADSTSLILDTVENCLMVAVEQVLEEHSIITQTTLDVNTSILEGIIFINATEDKETLFTIVDGAENEIDMLVNLLSFATNKPEEYFIDGILSVSPYLGEKILEMIALTNDVSLESKPVAVEDEKIAKLSIYLEKHPYSAVTSAIVNEFMGVGMPLEMLVSKFKLQVVALQGESAKQVAIEILGITLSSDTPFKDIVPVSKKLIDELFSDPRFIIDADLALDAVTREVYNG